MNSNPDLTDSISFGNAKFTICYSTIINNFSMKNQKENSSNLDSESAKKLQLSTNFGTFMGDIPLKVVSPKNGTSLGSTQQINNHIWKVGQKWTFIRGIYQNANKSTSFELGLTTGVKCVILSLTPPNHFYAYSSEKYLHFVNFDVPKILLSVVKHVLTLWQKSVVLLNKGLTIVYCTVLYNTILRK